MRIAAAAAYYTDRAGQKRHAEWDAMKFVKAVKGAAVHGTAMFMLGGKRYVLTDTNRSEAVLWFAEWAARQIAVLGVRAPVFVPIPCKASVAPAFAVGASDRIAEAIASRVAGARVAPVLGWNRALQRAHDQGGPRAAELLFPELAVRCAIGNVECVLVDDLTTLHGHIGACGAKLRALGATCTLAVCAGQSTWEHFEPPFDLPVQEIPDWIP